MLSLFNESWKREAKPKSYIIMSTPSFNEAYDLYSYKVGRVKAEKAWKRLSVTDKSAAYRAIPAYVGCTMKPSEGTNKVLRAHFATWLNNRRWEDEDLPTSGDTGAKLYTHKEMLESGWPTTKFTVVPQPHNQKPKFRLDL